MQANQRDLGSVSACWEHQGWIYKDIVKAMKPQKQIDKVQTGTGKSREMLSSKGRFNVGTANFVHHSDAFVLSCCKKLQEYDIRRSPFFNKVVLTASLRVEI